MAWRSAHLARALARLIASQAVVAALACVLFLSLGGKEAGRSALYGSLVALLPNLYLAVRMVRVSEKSPKAIVRALYRGEVVKFLLVAGLFAAVFRQPDLRPVPLFLTFAAVTLTHWFALLIDWREG